MSESTKKYNVCGVLISVNGQDKAELLTFLSSLEACEVLESNDVQIAVVVEDSHEKSAYDTMEYIKEHPTVLSITLVNHFFEEV